MKSFVLKSTPLAALLFVTTALAARGPITAGGAPPSAFERSRVAILTIMESNEVRSALEASGAILSITPVKDSNSLYLVRTLTRELTAEFTAACSSQSPICDFSAKVVSTKEVSSEN